ncbi:MAG: hypothetical protein IPM25_12380 [Chloracidobacterium sp.]|nr:hypothetical protein [Chloracidobacterium sp.]
MKKLSTAAFLAILTLLFCVGVLAQAPEAKKADQTRTSKSSAPTVREILDRYVTALGGREAITKINTRVSRGTVELIPMNLKGSFETIAAAEASSFSKISIGGIGDMLEGSDGKSGWSINPITGSRDKSGPELAQAKLINDFYRDIRLEKLFPRIELKGTDKVGERAVYVLTGAADGLPAETWYFDKETGLMVKSEFVAISPEGNTAMTVAYEDYRNVDGVMTAFRIRTQTPQFELVLNATEVKNGVPIDEAVFKRPKSN